jgi:hypothetical protein
LLTAGDMARETRADRSALSLIAANAFVFLVALLGGMTVGELAVAYWWQSAIITASFLIRVVTLRARSLLEVLTHWAFALVVLAAYGGAHFVYAMLLRDQAWTALDTVVCSALFAANHAYSLAHNIRLDRRAGIPLMTFVEAMRDRVVPMGLLVTAATYLSAGGRSALALAFVVLLKTIADVAGHVSEHRRLRGPG